MSARWFMILPAKSKSQQRLMAIAEHEPGKLYKRNRHMLKLMSKMQLHDYAHTPTKGLLEKVKK